MVDIRAFIYVNNIPQKDIAEYLGVSKGYISQVISGKKELSESNLSKLVNNPYGWDVTMLTTQSRDVVVERQESKCETDIADRLLAIIEDQKKDIQMLLEMLRDKDYEIKRLRDELDESKKGIAPGADRSLSADAV
jgi:transcriptional regulator with XRE-family HTH domain